MGKEQKKPVKGDARAARASLHDALNDLEKILENKKTSDGAVPKPTTDTPSGQQYDIPLLDDVVMRGSGVADAPPAGYEPPAPPHPPKPGSPEYEEACRLLVARIANEIEVIVQSRIEAALQSATDEIRQQVKNHIEIMLPEILDEITDERRRGNK